MHVPVHASRIFVSVCVCVCIFARTAETLFGIVNMWAKITLTRVYIFAFWLVCRGKGRNLITVQLAQNHTNLWRIVVCQIILNYVNAGAWWQYIFVWTKLE